MLSFLTSLSHVIDSQSSFFLLFIKKKLDTSLLVLRKGDTTCISDNNISVDSKTASFERFQWGNPNGGKG